MPRTPKQPTAQPDTSEPVMTMPDELRPTVDAIAWTAIEKLFPVWVKQRVAHLLQSTDPADVQKRQEIFKTLEQAIFANALAGAGFPVLQEVSEK
jgi:hypothetical protein